jgi:hypothetical protein
MSRIASTKLSRTYICGNEPNPLEVRVFNISWEDSNEYAVYVRNKEEKWIRAYGFDNSFGLGKEITDWHVLSLMLAVEKK